MPAPSPRVDRRDGPRSASTPSARVALGVAAIALGLSSGCGLSGPVFTIEMRVDGPAGPKSISYHFAGTETAYDYRPALPWRKAGNVGFGQSDVRVVEPAEGTTCTISVDGVEYERIVAAGGDEELWCSANAQSRD
ncbi:hypothetical protein FHR81_001080 [Actinoalloteichus hoggarensis]|uniref:Uncharacterized protein n=1 Tax=Actinoalloteichus hoggarensis TaxID=1470176 RepID=A0A221VZ61_9PSEU|nr:hypothetical protein [Actinoalloteichus hoggarensis]ASO18817.1 hypothetical protein AHOG_05820 [Actinoalloteichus hoggarensis]MBB5920050.1 hypothetical protein [Actinoalloteichus hoggarensis]